MDLAPFKFIDDVQQKQTLLSLNQVSPDGKPWISKKTLGEPFEIDPAKEREQLKQEALDAVRFDQEVQAEVMKLQNTLAQQVQAQQAMGQQTLQYDQQAVIAEADQIVQQLMQLDPGSRRSQTDALQKEDYVMYSVVTSRLRDAETADRADAIAQFRQGGGGSMSSAPPTAAA